METKVLEDDWAQARYEQLALIDEKRARGTISCTRVPKKDC